MVEYISIDRLVQRLGRSSRENERIIITNNDAPIAALVSLQDLEMLEALEDAADISEAKEAIREAEAEGGLMDFKVFLETLEQEGNKT